MANDVVQVTQKDINSGVPGHPKSCPVALAMSAWHQCQWNVDVEWAYATNDRDTLWELDSKVSTWIEDFDEGDPTYPIELVMDTELLTIKLAGSADSAEEGEENG